MRAGKAIGVALAVLVAAAVATSLADTGGGRRPGQGPAVMTHSIQAAPMIAALGGGPRLGVEIRDLSKEDVAKLKLPSQNGVAVDVVLKESAAEKAGVKAGDVVVQFDGENVRSAAQLTRLVRETVAGRTVKMGVVRDGKRMDLDVAPAEAESVFDLAVAGEKMPQPGQPAILPERALRWQQRAADAGPGRRCPAVLR